MIAEICQKVLAGFGMLAELAIGIVVSISGGRVTSGTAAAIEL